MSGEAETYLVRADGLGGLPNVGAVCTCAEGAVRIVERVGPVRLIRSVRAGAVGVLAVQDYRAVRTADPVWCWCRVYPASVDEALRWGTGR